MRTSVCWVSTVFILAIATTAACGQSLVPSTGAEPAIYFILPDAPDAGLTARGARGGVRVEYQTNIRPFSRLAVGIDFGLNGIGLQAATPLSNKWNLRAGWEMMGGSYSFNVSGATASSSFGATLPGNAIGVMVQPRLQTAIVAADWFPWYGGFRVSPGLTVYNGNRADIQATVQGGQQISVGSGTYVSDPNDPIRALLQTKLGRMVAPRLTVGWGNMIPREGRHFSFPFEIGVEYVGRPQLTLGLTGSECDADGLCFPLSVDPATQANIVQEQKQLNQDIAPLRFYPVLSSGFAYRF